MKKLLSNDDIASIIEGKVTARASFSDELEAAEHGYISASYLRNRRGETQSASYKIVKELAKAYGRDIEMVNIGGKICCSAYVLDG